MRFELIDQVVEQTADRLIAIKNVTSAEEYLADHFPTFAILPGVLMLETLVQAARMLVQILQPELERPLVLSEVRNVRYGNMVRPGQSLRVEVSLKSHDDEAWSFVGVGTVNGEVAVQGRFSLSPLTQAAVELTPV